MTGDAPPTVGCVSPMNMIWHRINPNDGLIFAGDNAGDVLMEFIFALFWNKGLSSFDSEDYVNVELSIGVRHDDFPLEAFSHVASPR